MSNRPDFAAVTDELVDMIGLDPFGTTPPNGDTAALRKRIELELHNAFVAGQESLAKDLLEALDIAEKAALSVVAPGLTAEGNAALARHAFLAAIAELRRRAAARSAS
jgi:hypothetical protein